MKKETEDLEKLINKKKSLEGSINYLLILLVTLFSLNSLAQETSYIKGNEYILKDVSVSGLKNFNEQTVITYTGLKEGQKIRIPGEQISAIISKLWKLDLFSDINFYLINVQDGEASIQIDIKELPTLSEFKITGLKKSKIETIVSETELKKGKKITENFIKTTKNYIVNKYKKDGFLNTKVSINILPDSSEVNFSKMLIKVDLGERVKINQINFTGNEITKSSKLKKKMKKTKTKLFGRFWKKSKFIEKEYKEDLTSILDFYKEKGYRDARIITDSVITDNNNITINIDLQEGNKYYFGDISFLGNSVYSDAQLSRALGLFKGDTYNGVLLKKRISDNTKPDGEDLSNLYQNNGYLFSNINPVEVSVENDTINFEIRVVEGKPAYFNKITVVGNTRTNDHVIYRELRTKPGNIYSKSQIVRTVRELGQMGFFDPEQISPDFKNVDPNAGTVDIEYGLVEKGASQVELQGGYGGGGFIGTLGLSFNNFSVRGLKDKSAYKPLPMGDGQALSLRLQANRFYNTASFSFSEPWLGGRQPVSFSTSISRTKQYRYDYFTGQANKNQFFEITGAQIGLAKKLRVPDDYFQLSQSIGYQYYNLSNYYTGLFTFGDGKSNNIFYQVILARDNTFVNPVFPLGGSQFAISAKLSLPYSLFNNIDYDDLENQAEYQNEDGDPDQAKIDQEKFKWLEFYKVKFNGTWYTRLVDKFVLKTHAEFGFLGAYNNKRGIIPFDRFYLGGDGMSQYAMDGRETVALRGYTNQSLSSQDGSTIYNKFSLELRYPITLKPSASIFALTFLESGNGYDSFREFNPFNAKRSAGLGIRIFMPAFGLLGIDFGYGFDSQFAGDLNAHGWETHFVIGQNF
ncbi:MAG: outer membrane protein assembly factor BamA [Flavobacteriaceae bacterium]|nr:outer membrane protein assembly factor BamA [Flavobacteriaceae bacterium]MBT4960528.1 outer membrane protein assembly factor BamA [Flavobacteriaceae bacterium]MBT5232515.1 outer membrane protein assembly factor BamA [Flavobacteriaceae bacterium]MBT5493981.1 outer membrane protein assembly factor BamA [Flavobacteriaceae bacterium]MBT6654344.1 outer membrane protein assembly factor BamA [Flavobacteriaceae bacterium]